MIKNFNDKETEKIYKREYSGKLPQNIQRTAMKKLWMMDAAPDLNSLNIPPGNRLELLHGKREGQYSIRINDQWRICFRWSEGDTYDCEFKFQMRQFWKTYRLEIYTPKFFWV